MKTLLLHLLLVGSLCAEARMVAFGWEVSSNDVGEMWKAISEGYAAKHGLLPTEEELKPLRRKFGESDRRVLDFPYMVTLSWKLNRVWWAKHQGRLVLSAFGVHLATDAMLKEVAGMEKAGEVLFLDPEARKKYFAYYEAYRGDGVVTGERARKILEEGPTK